MILMAIKSIRDYIMKISFEDENWVTIGGFLVALTSIFCSLYSYLCVAEIIQGIPYPNFYIGILIISVAFGGFGIPISIFNTIIFKTLFHISPLFYVSHHYILLPIPPNYRLLHKQKL